MKLHINFHSWTFFIFFSGSPLKFWYFAFCSLWSWEMRKVRNYMENCTVYPLHICRKLFFILVLLLSIILWSFHLKIGKSFRWNFFSFFSYSETINQKVKKYQQNYGWKNCIKDLLNSFNLFFLYIFAVVVGGFQITKIWMEIYCERNYITWMKKAKTMKNDTKYLFFQSWEFLKYCFSLKY